MIYGLSRLDNLNLYFIRYRLVLSIDHWQPLQRFWPV
jgi:hypothetical protein